MKGKIQTVLGLVDVAEAGFTLTHEHLLHDLPKIVFKQPINALHANLGLEDRPVCLENLMWVRQYPYCFDDNITFSDEVTRNDVREEMHFLKKCCGKVTVVDNCSVGLRAKDQAEYLKSVAQKCEINIVAGTGFYVAGAQAPSTMKMTQEEMECLMRDDILKGMGDESGVKCGVIGEIGCSWPILPFEKQSLAASAAVQKETGCPVIIHPGRDRNAPEEIIRLFQEAGGNVSKVVMSHLDRTLMCGTDLAEFASLGSYCEFDLFGTEVSHYQLSDAVDMPSDAQRIALLRYLVQHGFGDRLVASHDIHTKHKLAKYGGHSYSHLFLNVLPKMLKRGFSEDDVNKIFFRNPATWLAFE